MLRGRGRSCRRWLCAIRTGGLRRGQGTRHPPTLARNH
jgi:hypothetical protein